MWWWDSRKMLLSDVFRFFVECCIQMYRCQFQFLLCGTFSWAVINCFVVDQDKRGQNISFEIPVRNKSNFDLRRKKEKITGFRDTLLRIRFHLNQLKWRRKLMSVDNRQEWCIKENGIFVSHELNIYSLSDFFQV